MEVRQGMNCCGINEIAGLSSTKSAEDALKKFVEDTCFITRTDYNAQPKLGSYGYQYPMVVTPRKKLTGAHFIFTQAVKSARYGIRFARLIIDLDLGYLEETVWTKNPNSGRQVKCWVWTPDMKQLLEWYEGQKKESDDPK